MSEKSLPSLVSTEWLASHLDEPTVRIVDASYMMPGSDRDARAEFAAAHIPGAVFFDVDDIADPDTDLPHMLPSPQLFEEKVRALGIGNGDIVVAYDTHGIRSSPRAWWMFRVFGHDRVAVLDGGLPKWRREGRPLASGGGTPVPSHFTAHVRPELVRVADAVARNITGADEQVVDARSPGRFTGAEPEVWPGRRSGRIPGSYNVPYTDLLDPETQTFLPPAEIERRFREAGVDPARPVVTSCGSGLTACVLSLGLHHAGFGDVAVYDGSWAEWGLPSDRPVETGPRR